MRDSKIKVNKNTMANSPSSSPQGAPQHSPNRIGDLINKLTQGLDQAHETAAERSKAARAETSSEAVSALAESEVTIHFEQDHDLGEWKADDKAKEVGPQLPTPRKYGIIRLRISDKKGESRADRTSRIVESDDMGALEGSVDRVNYPSLLNMFVGDRVNKKGKKYSDIYDAKWRQDFHETAHQFLNLQMNIDFDDFKGMDKDQVYGAVLKIAEIKDPSDRMEWYKTLKGFGRLNTTGPEGVMQLLLAMNRALNKAEKELGHKLQPTNFLAPKTLEDPGKLLIEKAFDSMNDVVGGAWLEQYSFGSMKKNMEAAWAKIGLQSLVEGAGKIIASEQPAESADMTMPEATQTPAAPEDLSEPSGRPWYDIDGMIKEWTKAMEAAGKPAGNMPEEPEEETLVDGEQAMPETSESPVAPQQTPAAPADLEEPAAPAPAVPEDGAQPEAEKSYEKDESGQRWFDL